MRWQKGGDTALIAGCGVGGVVTNAWTANAAKLSFAAFVIFEPALFYLAWSWSEKFYSGALVIEMPAEAQSIILKAGEFWAYLGREIPTMYSGFSLLFALTYWL